MVFVGIANINARIKAFCLLGMGTMQYGRQGNQENTMEKEGKR